MRNFVCILSLLLLGACTYDEFDADEWDGGANELILQLSETIISLLSNQEAVDTVYVKTNGDGWSFEIDTTVGWCRGVQVDSMLVLFVDSNDYNISRRTNISVNAYYNHIRATKLLQLVQTENIYVDTSSVFQEPYVDFEKIYSQEWSSDMRTYYWNFYGDLQYRINSKLGYSDSLEFVQAVQEKRAHIKVYDEGGLLLQDFANDLFDVDFVEDRNENSKISMKITPRPNINNVTSQSFVYCIITNDTGREFVIKVVFNITKSLSSITQVVKCYKFNFELLYQNAIEPEYTEFSIAQHMPEIIELLGGEADVLYISRGNDIDYDFVWANETYYNSWIGNNGVITRPDNSQAVWLKFKMDGIFEAMCLPMLFGPDIQPYSNKEFRCRYLLVNSKTQRGVEMLVTVNTTYEHNVRVVGQYSYEDSLFYFDESFHFLDYMNAFNDSEISEQVMNDIGGSATHILMGMSSDYPTIFQDYSIYDGIIGTDGATDGTTYTKLVRVYFTDDVYLSSVVMKNRNYKVSVGSMPIDAVCIFRFVNADTGLASDLKLTIHFINLDQRVV